MCAILYIFCTFMHMFHIFYISAHVYFIFCTFSNTLVCFVFAMEKKNLLSCCEKLPVRYILIIELPMSNNNIAVCRLTGERGIPILPKTFEKLKFKGKGHEVNYTGFAQA